MQGKSNGIVLESQEKPHFLDYVSPNASLCFPTTQRVKPKCVVFSAGVYQ